MLCGGVILDWPGCAAKPPGFDAQATPRAWAAFCVPGHVWLLGGVFGLYLAAARGEPALAGTYAFVNPAVAVLLGWAFGGEALNLQM